MIFMAVLAIRLHTKQVGIPSFRAWGLGAVAINQLGDRNSDNLPITGQEM